MSSRARAGLAAVASLVVPGLGSAMASSWLSACACYALALAMIGVLHVETEPRVVASRFFVKLGVAIAIASSALAARQAKDASRMRWRLGLALSAVHFFVVLPAAVHWLIPLTPFQIDAQSMAPTLRPGDFFLARERRWSSRPIARGDVVAFRAPNEERISIKRVIGLASEEIDACGYAVKVNGRELSEPYVHYRPVRPARGCQPLRVPAGSLYLLGDNRAASMDSRDYGSVDQQRVVARAWFLFLSNDRTRVWSDVR